MGQKAFNMIQSAKHTETIIAFLGLVGKILNNGGLHARLTLSVDSHLLSKFHFHFLLWAEIGMEDQHRQSGSRTQPNQFVSADQ